MSHTSPPPSRTRRENEKGLVTDREGRYYVALHPLYSSTASRRRRVLAFRITVCLLSFLVFLFAIIGQVVPFAQEGKPKERETYSAWQHKEYKKDGTLDDVEDNKRTGGAKACAVIAVILALAALILSAIFAAFWSRDEKIRFDEEDANERLQAKYGVERSDADSSDSFPYENARIANDCVDEVPFEEAERQRLLLDRSMGIAVFALLIAAAVFALITLILMASFYNKRVAGEDYAKYREGLALFIVALVLAVIAFVMVAIPPASALYMCGGPDVRRADLMVLSLSQPPPPRNAHNSEVPTQVARRDGSREHPHASSHSKAKARTGGYEQQYDTEQQQQHQSTPPPPPPPPVQTQPVSNPYYPPGVTENAGMAVAQGIPMALPGPPLETLQQQQQPEYASGAYYQAPPQLFNVGNGKGGKGKSL